MNKKISALFVVLVIFIVGGSFALIFAWGSSNEIPFNLLGQNTKKEPILKSDVSDKCFGLDEMTCVEKEDCWGMYGSGSCGDEVCTMDDVFQKCVQMPTEIAKKGKTNKKFCEDTGGEWVVVLKKPGKCTCPQGSGFEDGRGCNPETLDVQTISFDDVAYINSIYEKNSDTYVAVDYIEWLSGEEAVAAMKEDKQCVEGEECIVLNDYYIRNKDKTIKNLKLASDVKVVMQTYSHTETGDMNWNESITLEKFREIFKEGSEAPWKNLPYHIILKDDKVMEIREQYVP